MDQHSSLTLERWRQFDLDQQILMIANELNRVSKLLGPGDEARRKSGYERTLALVDLTVAATSASGLRRELLRWRGLIAALYAGLATGPAAHAAALRVLLRFTPAASRQIPHMAAVGNR
jgi:hypothetical protein